VNHPKAVPRALAAFAAVVAVAVIVSGVAAASTVGVRPARAIDGSLIIGHLFLIDSLNPFIGFSNEAYLFYSLIYDFLFSVDEDQNYIPNLAESASTPDGGRTWVYQIRQTAKWHDGTPLTAEDVAFTINYNIQNFWILWAYEPYVKQIVQCRPGQTTGCGAEVTGPWEVTAHFDRPFAPGGSAMVLPILQKRQWQNITASDAQSSYTNPTPIGTGPFKADANIYQAWLRGDPLILHRNPDYHFAPSSIERVVFRMFQDENSLVAALLNGEVDAAMLSAAGSEATALSKGNRAIELQEGLTVIQYWIDVGITQLNHFGVNQRLNPARFDVRVREAMAHATDKTFILNQFYRGKGQEGSTLVSPVSEVWHYEPTTEAYAFDLSEAGAILDAAGYDARDPDGIRKASRDIPLTLYCSPENLERGCQTQVTVPAGTRLSFSMVVRVEAPEEKEIAAYLQQTWRSVGIELKGRDSPFVTVEEELAMNTDVYGGEFDTYIWWWSGDVDPNYILSIQSNFTLNGWSDNYYDNETYNNLYLAQLSEMDPAARRQHVFDAQKVEYLGAAFLILVYPYFHYAWWTDEYEGWGDMVAHPGRQLGAFWGKHPLFLELQPKAGAGDLFGLGLSTIGLIAGVVVAAVVAVAIVLTMRKRKAEEKPPEMPQMPPPPPG